MKYIECPNIEKINNLSFFLAGPIQGADNWQEKVSYEFEKFNATFLSPRRSSYDNFNWDEQICWETDMLLRADHIIFCIPKKKEDINGRDYAQTTRQELGEWLERTSKLQNKKVIVWADPEISGYKYFEWKCTQQYKDTSIWCKSYTDLIFNIQTIIENTDTKTRHTFFTSDTHFGAQRTLELSRRPFHSVKQMDISMIEKWNDVVKPWDIVYHLGDFGDLDTINYLNGEINLVMGNYEHRDVENGTTRIEELERCFSHVYEDYVDLDITYDKKTIRVHCIHEPEKRDKELFNLFGHIHGRCQIKQNDLGNGIDVGVDCNNYTPVSVEKVFFFENAVEKGYYDNNVTE